MFWNKRFNQIDDALKELKSMSVTLQQAMQDLTAQVAKNVTVEQSTITLIQGLAVQIAAAAKANDPTAVENLAAQLNASAGSLAAAIVANTPAS